MAGREREVTPRFTPGVLTPEQRDEAERRYSLCRASGYNCAKIDITHYPWAFRRRTLYGVWLTLVEDIWDDLQERHNNQFYSFTSYRKVRAKHDVDREVCELAVDFYRQNRLLVWEQFVNACSPFSKSASAAVLKSMAKTGRAYAEFGMPSGEGAGSSNRGRPYSAPHLRYVPAQKPGFWKGLAALFRRIGCSLI